MIESKDRIDIWMGLDPCNGEGVHIGELLIIKSIQAEVSMNTRLISAIDVVMIDLGRPREQTNQVGKGVLVFSDAFPGE